MLTQFLTPELIRIKVEPVDWKEAIRLAGMLLIAAGKCEPRYLDAMIESVEVIGPYIVLAPGLALAHARPEDGVLEMGMSLITLAKPVSFGSLENDPVSLIIAFGAVDRTSHMEMLSQLAEFLEQATYREKLISAENLIEVIEALESPGNSKM